MDRRQFIKWTCGGAIGGTIAGKAASASETHGPSADAMGVLVDTTECVGCRKCEWACNRANSLTDQPLERYEDLGVFSEARRMTTEAFTVVNRYENTSAPEKPVYVKSQCMHCVEPACASACLVGALKKEASGAVSYDSWKCIGCRYCMVACPFEVPTYEYEDPLAPRVRKCTFCMERTAEDGQLPACVEMCPPNALTYGRRSELIAYAHEKIAANPGRYVNHVYGEHEVGGTSWMYLASEPFENLGMRTLGDEPAQKLTETIQHSVFKFGAPPLMVFGLLAVAMRAFKNETENETASGGHEE